MFAIGDAIEYQGKTGKVTKETAKMVGIELDDGQVKNVMKASVKKVDQAAPVAESHAAVLEEPGAATTPRRSVQWVGVGAGLGAVAGALVSGPIGAAAGAALGAALGGKGYSGPLGHTELNQEPPEAALKKQGGSDATRNKIELPEAPSPLQDAKSKATAALPPSPETEAKPKPRKVATEVKAATPKKLDFDGETQAVMPLPLEEHMEYIEDVQTFKGGLYASAQTPLCTDVHQGEIGDCYLAAAFTLIAAKEPEAIMRAITEVGTGKGRGRVFKVTFGLYGPTGKKTADVAVTVNDSFFVNNGLDEPYYLNTGNKKVGGCIWQMVLEKAWAAFLPQAYDALYNPKHNPAKALKSSYELVGADNKTFNAKDNVNDACRCIAGWRVEAKPVSQGNAIEDLWKHVCAGQPAAFGTGKQTKEMIALLLYEEHQYAIVGFEESGKEGRSLIMRNPHNKLKGGPGPAVPPVVHRAKTAPKKDMYKCSQDGTLKMADAFVLPMSAVSDKVFETVYFMWTAK